MTTKYFNTKEQHVAFRKAWAKVAQDKKLTATHMVLYNIIRGKEVTHGFTPVTNTNKLSNGMSFNGKIVEAIHYWKTLKTMTVYYNEADYYRSFVDRFLSGFEDVLTVEDLSQIEIPQVEEISPNFGKGRKILEKIQNGERPTTFQQLDALALEDVA